MADESRLVGDRVVLRPAGADDMAALVAILGRTEVARWWDEPEIVAMWARGDAQGAQDELLWEGATSLAIEVDGVVRGLIQFAEEDDPSYRHASIDVFLDPDVHGRGLGTDAVRTLARHLVHDRGHHRLTIDPAAENARAIATYRRVGFRPVGVLRRYERAPDGTWRDGLLMDLLAEELA